MPEVSEGWGWPPGSRTAHYFVNRVSLCGVWMGEPDKSPEESPDNCPECRKRLMERRAKK